MSKASKKKKMEQLGMNPATAANQLRKKILFSLLKEAGLDNCYHCGEKIEFIMELSIEHKIPWLDSDNPGKLYFDLDNIAFSHLSCNTSAGRRATGPQTAKHGGHAMYNHHKCRCEICRKGNAAYARQLRKKQLGP